MTDVTLANQMQESHQTDRHRADSSADLTTTPLCNGSIVALCLALFKLLLKNSQELAVTRKTFQFKTVRHKLKPHKLNTLGR